MTWGDGVGIILDAYNLHYMLHNCCIQTWQLCSWTATQSFQLGGHLACRWCGSSNAIVYQTWSS